MYAAWRNMCGHTRPLDSGLYCAYCRRWDGDLECSRSCTRTHDWYKYVQGEDEVTDGRNGGGCLVNDDDGGLVGF